MYTELDYGKLGNNADQWAIYDGTGRTVGLSYHGEHYARLFASAPELLEALEALLPVAQAFEKQASKGAGGRRGGPVFAKARAAIAKAKEG